jgi:hypothetical protein
MPMLRPAPVLRPFRYVRQALPWFLALAVATCTADQGAPSESGVGYFSFRPVYHLAGGASLSQFGIVADSVRIRLTRPVDQVVLDTAVFFPADSGSLHLALPVELLQSPETLTAVITISAGGGVIFLDSVQAEVKDGPPGSTTPPTVTFDYVGPGSNIAAITMLPGDTTVILGDTLFFTAIAVDSSAGPVASFYVGWKTTDTTIAKINANGRLIAPALRGSVRVVGTTPTGIGDTTLVTFAPVPVTIYADSGKTQLGVVGDSLGALFVARVMGADSLGISGIPVKFQAVTVGGAVRDTLIITDALGRARTRALLGDTARAYSYTATALGTALPAASFTGTAGSAAAAAIAITQGNGQVDTTGKTLGLPLGVNVRDAFGNRVGGAMVIFTRTAGSGTVGNDTVFTAVDGDASTAYTLGAVVGVDSITAQLAGTSAFVVFTETGVSNLPTQIIQGLGGSQNAVAGTLFADSLTVQVLDNGDNPVGAVMVYWTVASGTATLSADSTPTDINGHAAVALTAGTLAGPVDVAASVAGIASPTTFNETVAAGAPASMVISSGNGQTGTSGSGLALAPEVLVTDAFSNPITGVTVDFAVTAGTGSIDSASATTDPTGRANAGLWTLGLAGLNQVRATTTAIPADTLLFDATSTPSGTSKVWTAAVNNAWNLAGNWSPNGIPTALDNVFIPASVTSPVIPVTSSINDLGIEAGATVTLAAITLNVSGNADIAGILTGTGVLNLTGTGTGFRGTTSTALVQVNGTPILTGPTSIAGPLTVTAGSLTVGGRSLAVTGALTVQGSGQLMMTNAADSVDVTGATLFNGSSSGTGDLSAGVLVLRGNFTQAAGATTNFAPSGTHTTRFLGASTQAISFGSPGSASSRFQNVEFGSAAGTTINSTVTVMDVVTVSAGTVTGIGRTINIGGALNTPYAAWQVSNTLWGQNPTAYPDSLPRNVTVFNAWTLTKPFKTDSSLTVNGTGILTLNGNTLQVGGALTQGGALRMQNAADTLDVGKMFTAAGGAPGVGDLSAGVLMLRGGLTQSSGAVDNFQPSGSHLVRFVGSTPQTVSFGTSGVTSSRFADVEFADAGGVTLASNIYTAGTASVTAGTVTGVARTASFAGDLATSYSGWQVSTTLWVGTPTVYPDSLPRNVSLGAALTLTKGLKVDSAFTVSPAGALTLNGHAVRVGRAFTQSGLLSMQDPADTLDIGGLFTVNSSTPSLGQLSDGLLRLRGGFTQSAGAVNNFQASGSHLTRFEAAGGQTVSFGTPGAANSAFQLLEVADVINVSSNLYVAGNVTMLAGGKVLGNTTATLAGDLVDPSDSSWRFATTQLIGTPTTLPDSMKTNLVLPGSWTLARRTVVDGNVTVTASGSLVLNGDSLRVMGAFTQTGALTMTDPTDLLDVGGTFTVNSSLSSAGQLTNGRLLLRGGFSQSAGAVDNFAPSQTQVTEFAGVGGHALGFGTPSAANSHFRQLVVADSLTVAGNVSVTGDVVLRPTGRMVGPNTGLLLGNLVDSSLAGWRMATTSLDGSFQLIPSALVSNVILNDSIALAQPTTVTGNFTVQNVGNLTFGGHGLGVSGNFNQNATLQMNSTQDSLEVGGNFLVSSSNDGTGKLTAGVLVLHGGLTQSAGSVSNFVGTAPHRVRFTGTAARTISFGTAAQSTFGDLEVDATGVITLNSAVNVTGTFSKPAGAVSPFTAGIQRLLRVGDLAVDGATFDRVRLEMHATSNAAQFDNVTFTNQDLTQTQLSLELPGQTGDTLKFTNVAFDGIPTTGRYLFVADSVANGAPATVGFYNSTPLNGALFTTVEGSVGDPANILWSHLEWVTQPTGGTALLGLIPAPQVGAFDPSGVPLVSFTGTVTLAFLNNPIGALLGNNTVAAVGGVAKFDSLTLNLAAIGFTLQASAPGLGLSPASAPFDILVPLPVGTTTAFNNGGGDNDWFNAVNWTAGVPDSADNVFVYPGQTATVNTPSEVNRIVIGTGGTIVLNAPLTADSSIAAGNTISGGGQLIAKGTGTLSGVVGDLLVTGNYLVPTGGHLSASTVTIDGIGVLDPGTDTIAVTDSLLTASAGILNMTSATAVVDIGGNAVFNGGQSTLNGGLLRLRKGLTSVHNFAVTFTPASNIAFVGTGTQAVSYAVADSNNAMGNILFTGDTLRFVTNVQVGGSIALNTGVTIIDSTLFAGQAVGGGAAATLQGSVLSLLTGITFPGAYAVGTTVFAGNGITIPALANPYDTVWVSDTAQLGATVTANVFYAVGVGRFDLGGHRLDVLTDFGTGGSATFAMTSDADSLFVGGTFFAFGGSTAGLLTNGLVQIAGNFYQGGIPNSVPAETQGPPPALDGYRADGLHTTRFIGDTGRTIYFGSPVQPADPFSTANSSFGRLELIDGTDSVGSTLPVTADLLVDSAHVVNASQTSGGPAVAGNIQIGPNVPEFTISNVSLGGVLDFQPAPALYQVGTTLFFGNGQSVPVLPYQDIEVAIGQATLSGDISAQNVKSGVAQEGPGFPGDLKLGGHKLIVAGNFTTVGQGSFTMDDPADSLDVTGNMDLGGGVSTGLTAGTVVARGDMYLSDSDFVASGTHRTVFASPSSQQLWITTAIDETGNQFNFLTVQAGTTVNFNAFSVGPLVVKDTFAINGHFTQASPGKAVIALGDLYAGFSASITVDYVELHKSLDIDASSYSVQQTRYAGTGQIVSATTSYNDLEITGTGAVLDSTVTVNHDFAIHGGDFSPAGHTLAIAHDLLVDEDGLLKMSAATDSVNVGYTATFDGRDSDGWLTAGTLTFNYFKQLATTSPNAFRATAAHRAVMLAQNPNDETEMITFATPGAAASQFQELEFNSGGVGSGFTYFGAGTIYVADSVLVAAGGSGGLFGSGTTLIVGGPMAVQTVTIPIQLDTLELRAAIVTPPSSLNNTVTRFAGFLQAIPDSQAYQQVQVTGSVHMESSVTANQFTVLGNGQFTMLPSQQLTVSGDFATLENGTLQMNSPNADLIIQGNTTFGGGAEAGLLTDGVIHLEGNFTELPGTSNETFTTTGFGTGVQFLGSVAPQVVTLDPATIGNFHSIGITNPFGIQIVGNMVVTDSVGSSGPIVGDSLSQFGNFFIHSGAEIGVRVFKTAGLLSGPPASYTVGRTHIVNPNTLPSVTFDTLVINAAGVSAFFPINASELIVAGVGSPFSFNGAPATLDLGINNFPVRSTITGNVSVEGSNASLNLAEDTLAVGGNFQTILGGTLVMADPNGSLEVSGGALFDGGDEIGQLTGGTFTLGGDLVQLAGTSPSSFRVDGAVLDLTLGSTHRIAFATPDFSWLPDINAGGAAVLSLDIAGRARVAGGISAYGLSLSGDTLVTDGQLSGSGTPGLSVTLARYEGPVMNQFQQVPTWAVSTTQFTGDGGLPFSADFAFDTLIVSANVQGQLSQGITANYIEVTGPGNPKHIGGSVGRLGLSGGDGNTIISVNGSVLVRGAGATINNNRGSLSTTGDLLVDQGGLLVSTATGCCGTTIFDIGGNATFNGASTKDSLTAGLFRLTGDLIQGGPDPESFATDTGFATILMGGGTHRIVMANPSAIDGGGSQFGILEAFGSNTAALYQTTYVSNNLFSVMSGQLTFTNQAGSPIELSAHNVIIEKANFDDVTLHWFDPALLPLGAFVQVDSITFTNFQADEVQMIIEGTETLPQPVLMHNIVFSPLNPAGSDSGLYVRTIDDDSPFSTTVQVQISTPNFADPSKYFEHLNGSILSLLPFP